MHGTVSKKETGYFHFNYFLITLLQIKKYFVNFIGICVSLAKIRCFRLWLIVLFAQGSLSLIYRHPGCCHYATLCSGIAHPPQAMETLQFPRLPGSQSFPEFKRPEVGMKRGLKWIWGLDSYGYHVS